MPLGRMLPTPFCFLKVWSLQLLEAFAVLRSQIKREGKERHSFIIAQKMHVTDVEGYHNTKCIRCAISGKKAPMSWFPLLQVSVTLEPP